MLSARKKSLAIVALIAASAAPAIMIGYLLHSSTDSVVNNAQLLTPSMDGPAQTTHAYRPRNRGPVTAMPQIVTLPNPDLGPVPIGRNNAAVPGLIALAGAPSPQTAEIHGNTRAPLDFALHPSLRYKNWGTAASDAVTGYGLHLATVENPADQSPATPSPTAPRSVTQQRIDANLRMETDRHSVLAMCEDQQGCLWVAAEDSVQRFDPAAPELHQWTEFTTSEGLGDNGGTTIACDRRGRIWVGHKAGHGVSIFNGQKWQNYGSIETSSSTGGLTCPLVGQASRIALNPAGGDLWIATDCGLTRYSDSKDTWSYEALPTGEASSLAFDKKGNIFVGTKGDGIAMAEAAGNYQDWRQVRAPNAQPTMPEGGGLPSNAINDVLVATDGTIYAATDSGLAWSQDTGQTWQFTRGANWAKGIRHPAAAHGAGEDGVLPARGIGAPAPLLAEDDCTCLAEATEGKIYVGHRGAAVDLFEPAQNRAVAAGLPVFVKSIVTAGITYLGVDGHQDRGIGYPGPGGVIPLSVPASERIALVLAEGAPPTDFPSGGPPVDSELMDPEIELKNLKDLYDAGEFAAVLTKCGRAAHDQRYSAWQPQILYIAWACCRRQQGPGADSWRKQFLDQFPDNPLGADMYFAAAMDALAASNYGEASRLLQLIEYRFPESKIIDKVREIRARLAAVDNANAPSTAPVAVDGQ